MYTAYNDSHRNALRYQNDSQAPENTSHFDLIFITVTSPCGGEDIHVDDGASIF